MNKYTTIDTKNLIIHIKSIKKDISIYDFTTKETISGYTIAKNKIRKYILNNNFKKLYEYIESHPDFNFL